MKTKLGYLCSSQSWGGLEMNHVRNAEWMKERGHLVVIICIANSPIEKWAISKKIPTLRIPKHKKYYDFKNARQLASKLTTLKVTHLIVRSTYDISIASNIKRQLKDQLHTSYFMEMQLGVKKTNVFHTLRYKHIDLWSCPLSWLQMQVKEMTHFKNELIVIPSGLDLGQFSNLNSKEVDRKSIGINNNSIVFGLIGRFDVQKGQLLLLKALQTCRNKDFQVALLGEPTKDEGDLYFEEMKIFIKQNHLTNRVSIHPFQESTKSFYNAIDWLVMATKAETFGMVTIESLACGTPVLGSNAGGTPEILENETGGILFETLNSDSLAQQIDKIIDEKIEFNSEKLIEMAQKYNHTEVCLKVEKALKI